MNNPKGVKRRCQDGNFWYLFVGLLIALLAVPLAQVAPSIGRYSMTLLFTLFMLASVWSLSASRHIFRLGVTLTAMVSCMSALGIIFGPVRLLEAAGLLLFLLFSGLSCTIAARNVFVLHKVDLNSITGSFCVYLLLGLIWATLYRLCFNYGVGRNLPEI